MRVDSIHPNLAFKAKDVTLFSDFDGTFFQSSAVNNDYFQAFDDFRGERKDKFKIFITTGRRLEGGSGGFLGTFNSLKSGGYKLPKLDGIITCEGGDVFLFNSKGEIDKTPLAQKRALMKQKTGWDFEFIMEGLKNISQKLGTEFTPVDKRSFHKISLVVDDSEKLEAFADEIDDFFIDNKISAGAELKQVNADSGKQLGIKLSPRMNGHHIHKDFDIFHALKNAQRENDFVIVAGNEKNDKELLNLFNYIGERRIDSVEKIPKKGLEEMIAKIKKLPIGIIFVDSPDSAVSPKLAEMKKFIEAQQKLFPDKVRIISETKSGERNTLVQAARELVNIHFPETPTKPAVREALTDLKAEGSGKFTLYGALALGVCATVVYSLQKYCNQKKD